MLLFCLSELNNNLYLRLFDCWSGSCFHWRWLESKPTWFAFGIWFDLFCFSGLFLVFGYLSFGSFQWFLDLVSFVYPSAWYTKPRLCMRLWNSFKYQWAQNYLQTKITDCMILMSRRGSRFLNCGMRRLILLSPSRINRGRAVLHLAAHLACNARGPGSHLAATW